MKTTSKESLKFNAFSKKIKKKKNKEIEKNKKESPQINEFNNFKIDELWNQNENNQIGKKKRNFQIYLYNKFL